MKTFKKYLKLIFVILSILVISAPQCSNFENNSSIKIPLEQIVDLSHSPPFYGMTNIFFADPAPEKFNFFPQWSDIQIADIISNENYKKIYVARYKDPKNGIKYSVDTDADLDFTDEKPLNFTKAEKLDFADIEVQIIPQSDSLHKPYKLHFQIILSKSEGYSYARINEYRKGKVTINNEDFNLILRYSSRNYPYFDLSNGLMFLIDQNKDGIFNYNWSISDEKNLIPSEQIAVLKPFILADQAVQISNIDIYGNEISLKRSTIKETAAPGFQAPNFETQDLDGSKIELSNLAGNLVLIDLWSVDCVWSEHVRPDLNKLYDKYKNNGFSWLAISKEIEATKVSNFVKDHPRDGTLLLSNDFIKSNYDSGAYPAYYLVDKSGKIILYSRGASIIKILESIVTKYL